MKNKRLADVPPVLTGGLSADVRPRRITSRPDQLWCCIHLRNIGPDHQSTQVLQQLLEQTSQFSPCLSLQPPRELLLEIAASLKLFGGMQNLLQRIQQTLLPLPHDSCLGVAPTPLAATLLARTSRPGAVAVTGPATLHKRLLPLPVECLPETMSTKLQGMGLQTLGDLLRLPRAGLAQRAGPELLTLLDRAFGKQPDPQIRYRPAASFHAELPLPADIANRRALLYAAEELLQQLSLVLQKQCAGIEQLTWTLLHRRYPDTQVDFVLHTARRDMEHYLLLLRERLDSIRLPGAVESLHLDTGIFQPMPVQTGSLLPGHAQQQPRDPMLLIERLRAKLGQAALQGLQEHAEHRPEYAWRYTDIQKRPMTATDRIDNPPGRARPARPVWLLASPRPLRTVHGRPWWQGELTLLAGPERIESGWWDGHDCRRDYFVTRHSKSGRLWVFREPGEKRWFLHGFFP